MDQKNSEKEVRRHEKAEILIEALPFMRRYAGKSIVVKFGGNAMGEQAYAEAFAADMMLLRQVGAMPVVVHGGGPQIGDMLKKLEIESNFVNGLRVTDEATISVVEMVLSGAVNKALVGAIIAAGGNAVGLSGKDGGLIRAEKLNTDHAEQQNDLGFVGKPQSVDPKVLYALLDAGMIPVIAPIGLGEGGTTFNINADTAAGALASAINARRLLMLTDVAGVKDKDGHHIPKLTIDEARALIVDGTVQGGMIPKVETCIDAVEQGAEAAVILDGRSAHAVLVELFTEHGIGTLITK